MSRITLVRCAEPLPGDGALAGVRRFLFGLFDGWSRDDKKGWRNLWKRLMALEPGEFATVEFVIPRSSPYHRRHMAIEAAVFDAQERFTDFEQFRTWVKVGAAWCRFRARSATRGRIKLSLSNTTQRSSIFCAGRMRRATCGDIWATVRTT